MTNKECIIRLNEDFIKRRYDTRMFNGWLFDNVGLYSWSINNSIYHGWYIRFMDESDAMAFKIVFPELCLNG